MSVSPQLISNPVSGPSKRLAIMQPYLFPYLGYFQVMHAVDEYVVYDDVNFIKGGWINRNNILMSGERKLFTIALTRSSPNRLINEINILDDFKKFLKLLNNVYGRAPCKGPVMELIERICTNPDKNLARFAMASLQEIAEYLGIRTRLIFSSDLEKDRSLPAQEKVLYICKRLGADCYINAIGGQALYDRTAFHSCGIELKFLQTREIEYPQFHYAFVQHLSIIDVMMFNTPTRIRSLLDSYDLI